MISEIRNQNSNILNFNRKKDVSFKSNSSVNNPLDIRDEFLSRDSKEQTITILGSSRDAQSINEITKNLYNISKKLVLRGYNILTGCGSNGIMGAASKGASSAEKNPENPQKNLAILVNPLWGDEDTVHSKVIAKNANSESDRIENGFLKTSNNFLVFPGGASSIQEAATIIAKNKYRPKGTEPLKIYLVGKDYYSGLVKQYDDMYKAGILGAKPNELFEVIEPDQVLEKFPQLPLG